MIRTAFSTVACPDWTLERVAKAASDWGYLGVELRSFGGGATRLACDPALTDPEKVRRLFNGAGLDISSIATGLRFDEKIVPPVLGHVLLERHASVNEGRFFVELSRATGAHATRVFGFEARGREPRRTLVKRIGERLRLVCDHARHDVAPVVLENGGAFSSAHDLMELIDAVDHPRLGAAYDLRAGLAAGDDPREAIALLEDRLRLARVRDARSDQTRDFCEALGEGVVDDAWLVFEWPRLWDETLAPAESVLPDAAGRLLSWANAGSAQRVA